jgi:hypothetical protein
MNVVHFVTNRRQTFERRGAVLAAALIAFAAAAAILFTILQSALSQHRQIRDQQYLAQARLLAQAGIDRSVANLRNDPAYRSELWQIDVADLNDIGPAEVRISIEPTADQTDEFRISVEASFPSDSDHRAQQTQTALVRLKHSEKQP